MTQVKAVPDGYTTITPFLNIKGAAEAIEFYKKALGAEERAKMAGPNGMIVHAELKIGNSILMISDAMMNPPTQSSCHLFVDNCDAWWKRATDAGMQITLPMENAFWGDRYGVLTDKWGNRWAIASRKEDVPRDEMATRAAEAMKNMK